MKKKTIVSSSVEPNKDDLWLKDGNLNYYGSNGWETLNKETIDLSKYDKCINYIQGNTFTNTEYIITTRTVNNTYSTITIPIENTKLPSLISANNIVKLKEYPKVGELKTEIAQLIDEKVPVVDDEINENSSNAVKNSAIYKALQERAYGAIFTIAGSLNTLTTESTDEEIRNALSVYNNTWIDKYRESYPDKSTEPTDSFYILRMLDMLIYNKDAHMVLNDLPYWVPVYISKFSDGTLTDSVDINLKYTAYYKGKEYLYIIYLKVHDLVWSIPKNPTIIDLENVNAVVERESVKTFTSWDEYNNYVTDLSFISDTNNICRKFSYYNTESNCYSTVNFSQTLDTKYCKQVAMIGIVTHERLIIFTDTTRRTIESIGDWS